MDDAVEKVSKCTGEAKSLAKALREGKPINAISELLQAATADFGRLGALYKENTSASADSLGTSEGDPLAKALADLNVADSEKQARDDKLSALRASRGEFSTSRQKLSDALKDFSEALSIDTDALKVSNATIQKTIAYLSSNPPDEATILSAGDQLRIAEFVDFLYAGSTIDLGSAVKKICKQLSDFDSASANDLKLANKDLSDAADEAIKVKLDIKEKCNPLLVLKAITSSMTSTSTTLGRALSLIADGRSADLKNLAAQAESVLTAVSAVQGALDSDPGHYVHRAVIQSWITDQGTVSIRRILESQILQAREAIEGDFSQFVTDTVSLYYFPDIKRLIYTLNKETERIDPANLDGALSSAGQLEAKKIALRAAERNIATAYDDLAQATIALAAKRVETDEKARKARLDSDLVNTATSERDLAQRNADRSAANLKKIQDEYTDARAATPPNEKKIANIKRDLDKAEKENTARQAILEDREAKLAGAKSTTSEAEVNTAAADEANQGKVVEDLTKTIILQNKTLRNARFDLQASQEEELKAFAFDRDNKPFYRAPAAAGATDPAHRVVMYAYDDSKVLLIRGTREDVAQVKDIVAQFDEPTPQARITLWSLDLNVQNSRQGRSSLGDVMPRVDAELLAVREKTGTVARDFRKALNTVVHDVEVTNISRYRITNVGLNLDQARMARLCFYAPEVSTRLGFDRTDAITHQRRYYFTRWTVPDPAGSTTLGEAIMMYCLADKGNRIKVINTFRDLLTADLQKLRDSAPRSYKKRRNSPAFETESICDQVNRLIARLDGLTLNSQSGSDGLSSEQLEILSALKRAALEKFIVNAPALCQIYRDFNGTSVDGKPIGEGAALKSYRFGNVSATNKDVVIADKNVLQWNSYSNGEQNLIAWVPDAVRSSEQIEVAYFLWPVYAWMKEEFGISPETFAQADNFAQNAEEAYRERRRSDYLASHAGDSASTIPRGLLSGGFDSRYAAHCIQYFRNLFPRSLANARIAAADEMLKQMMVQFEDALDATYIQPALVQIRKDVTGNKLDVGQFQRTSLLATNRYVARVAPSASAQLDLSGQTNLLEDAEQLVTLAAAAQGGQVPAILKAINKLPGKEPAPQLYALNGKSSFVVTPIFDPSGQALRFQFDYLKTLNIQSPEGSTDPQLPRVESYPISLPVQISNLELREVTRFEQNAKLGIPTKQWGGIPVLNQIPHLRDIPIIGWFSKRDGAAAVSQHTIILAQTATYPTIEDISHLLSGEFQLYMKPIVFKNDK